MEYQLKVSFSCDAPDDVTLEELTKFCDAVGIFMKAARGDRFGKRMSRVTTTRGNSVDVGF